MSQFMKRIGRMHNIRLGAQTNAMNMFGSNRIETRNAEVSAMGIMLSFLRTAMVMIALGFVITRLSGDNADPFSITLYVFAGVAVLIGLIEYAMLRSSLSSGGYGGER